MLVAVAAWLPVAVAAAGPGEPYLPADDAEVLEQLPLARGAHNDLRALQQQLAQNPRNLQQAIAYARASIELGRQEQDPRDFGYAEAALAPWWNRPDAPSSVVLLRATLEQWRHDFAAASHDLDALLAADAEESTQAHLTRASVRMVQGDPVGALRDCVALIGRADVLIAATCIAQANSLRGRAAVSLASLRSVLAQSDGAAPGLRLWALTSAAEIAARLGRDDEAAELYRTALAAMDAAATRDPYLLASASDFLLEQGNAKAVVARLAPLERIDNLLLRLALAEQQLAAAGDAAASRQLAAHLEMLEERFAETRQRQDSSVHLREEALFELQLRHAPARALELAVRNWRTQREPADARVLLAAAIAAHRPQAAAPVLEWMAGTQIEDTALTRLAQVLRTEQGV
ncbi:MAG: hypothetical protein P4L83_05115 [Nevskia sp.]|nr:hypothetical protein [Nevskia sp.]